MADIFTYHVVFHLWTEGILGGTDSFDQNPQGTNMGGHVKFDANTPDQSVITVEEWGNTGPPDLPGLFTTFLVTVDLSSSGIEVLDGQQYVMSLLQKASNFGTPVNGILGGGFRISGSLATSSTEDLYRDNLSTLFPGYIDSQLGFGFVQYAGYLSTTPTFAVGDVNQDGAINLLDVAQFIDLLSLGEYQFEADIDGNGVVKLLDVDPFILLLSGG